MRRPIVAGNWKMHGIPSRAAGLAREIKERVAGLAEELDVVLCPPFPSLAVVAEAVAGSAVAVGAQNLYWENEGAYTGEVSAPMLVDAGCDYVILGHSERRQYFGETDAGVARKIRAALAHGLTPIVCVGELLEEREKGQTTEVVGRQLEAALAGLEGDEVPGLVVAYEPVWAIGTGKAASPADAAEVAGFIRERIGVWHGAGAARAIRIQYGGSVKPGNADDFFDLEDIDGALVGGASLDAASFAAIVQKARGMTD